MLGLQNFGEKFAKRIQFESWMLMFLYEFMREKVVIRYPVETGDTSAPQIVQQRHNETLKQLLSQWKPESKDLSGLCTAMKVTSFYSFLIIRSE